MSKYTHTSEPWREESGCVVREDGAPIARMIRDRTASEAGIYPVERDENAKRIVACVNACKGIEDPAAFVAAAYDARLTLRGCWEAEQALVAALGGVS